MNAKPYLSIQNLETKNDISAFIKSVKNRSIFQKFLFFFNTTYLLLTKTPSELEHYSLIRYPTQKIYHLPSPIIPIIVLNSPPELVIVKFSRQPKNSQKSNRAAKLKRHNICVLKTKIPTPSLEGKHKIDPAQVTQKVRHRRRHN